MIFGHFIHFGHFTIEIPIEAEKSTDMGRRGQEQNKNSFETSEPSGKTWEHAKLDILKKVK